MLDIVQYLNLAKKGTHKQEEELVELCASLAEEITGEDTYVYIDSEDFSAMAKTADNEDVGNSIGIMIQPELDEFVDGHREVELELYGDVDYGFDYFTMSVLHEIGHLVTMRDFDSWELHDAMDRYVDSGRSLLEYKVLPHEAAADQWSLLHYIPNNWERVAEFNTRAVSLLLEIREETIW